MALFTTILWDVDNTLLDFQLSQRYALEKAFEANYLMINEEIQSRYDEINHAYWKRFELGEVTKEELLKGRFLTLFDAFGIQNVDLPEFMRVYLLNVCLSAKLPYNSLNAAYLQTFIGSIKRNKKCRIIVCAFGKVLL